MLAVGTGTVLEAARSPIHRSGEFQALVPGLRYATPRYATLRHATQRHATQRYVLCILRNQMWIHDDDEDDADYCYVYFYYAALSHKNKTVKTPNRRRT